MKIVRHEIGLREVAVVAILLSLCALASSGCSRPQVVGPQITRIPPGFMFDANATGARLVFHERPKVDQRGYFYMTRNDEHCSIMITEFAGPTTVEEARAARDHHRRTYGNQEYGAFESFRIDGKEAWGWETRQTYGGELASVAYQAVVSCPERDATYTVEFYAGVDRFMDPDLLRDTARSFRVKEEREVSYGQIGLIAVLGLGLAIGFRRIRPSS